MRSHWRIFSKGSDCHLHLRRILWLLFGEETLRNHGSHQADHQIFPAPLGHMVGCTSCCQLTSELGAEAHECHFQGRHSVASTRPSRVPFSSVSATSNVGGEAWVAGGGDGKELQLACSGHITSARSQPLSG